PAVNVAHRLLKNSIQSRLGYRAYLFVTDAAAAGLGLTGIGVEHLEDYPDAGQVQGRVIDVGENSPEAVTQVLRVDSSSLAIGASAKATVGLCHRSVAP